LRLGEAEDALAVQQFDEVELDFIAIIHKFIVRENCEIAIGDGCSGDERGNGFTPSLIPAFSPRRRRIVFRLLENSRDWIGRTVIRKTRIVQW
jgi:hypothetical protein